MSFSSSVDKRKGVRDVRSNHHGSLLHMYMYSILAGRSRTPAAHLSRSGCVASLPSLPSQTFLPAKDDIKAVRSTYFDPPFEQNLDRVYP